MTGFEWFGLGLAFLAPVPPERAEPPPEPLRGNEWAAALVIGSVFLMTVVPMITIWGFHRPHDAGRARCAAPGGRAVPAALDGSGPSRCERDGVRR